MKMTIKLKLFTAFILLILLSGIIYYVGNTNISRLRDSIDTIVDINAKRTMLAWNITADLHLMSRIEKEALLADNIVEVQDFIKEIEDRNTQIIKKVDELKSISDEKGLELIDDFLTNWNQYQKVYSKIKALSLVNTDSTADVAYVLARNEGQEAMDITVDVLTKIVTLNNNSMAVADTASDELYEEAQTSMLLILMFSIIVSTCLALWIIFSITGSLNKANNLIKVISQGDLTVTIDNIGKDEIGVLLQHLKNMVEKLKEVIGTVSSAADNIASASEQMSSSSQQMSEGSTEQAASAEEVSSSMEQMAANIQQNTDNAQQTEKIASKAAEDVQEGSRAVNQTVDSMKKIAEKISIIGEIARQTNLLALNAAVEAARAGEHGKGFAVVAAEVRKLAERSQVAANEINELSSSSVSIADKSGKLLEQIVPNIQNTSRLVQEINAASMEQNAGAEQVNNAIQQLNQVIQQNAAGAEEIASSSEELSSQAEQLRDTIGFFNVGNTMSTRRGIKTKRNHQHTSMSTFSVNTPKAKKELGLHLDLGGEDSLDNNFEKY